MTTLTVAFLLCGLFWVPVPSNSGFDRFVGEWRGSGRGIVKLQIGLFHDQLRVHPFGACHPQACDWGDVEAQAYAPRVDAKLRDAADAVLAQFATTFSRTTMLLYPVNANQLRVEVYTAFTDDSGRAPHHFGEILDRRK